MKASVENGRFLPQKKKEYLTIWRNGGKNKLQAVVAETVGRGIEGRVRQMGEAKRLSRLYRRYARRLYGFFFRMLGRKGVGFGLHTGTVLARMGGKGAV